MSGRCTASKASSVFPVLLFLRVVLIYLLQSPACADSAQSADLPGAQMHAEVAGASVNCGVAALYCALRIHKSRATLEEVERAVLACDKGFSLQALKEAAEEFGFHVYALRIPPEDLLNLEWPSITYMNTLFTSAEDKHFATILARRGESLLIFSPPKDFGYIDAAQFGEYWDGETLIITTRPVDPASLMPFAASNTKRYGAEEDAPRSKRYRFLLPALLFAVGLACIWGALGWRGHPRRNAT